MRFSQRAVHTYCYFINIFTETKQYYVLLFCGYYSVLLDLNMLSMTTKKSNAYFMLSNHASPECHVGRYRFIPPATEENF